MIIRCEQKVLNLLASWEETLIRISCIGSVTSVEALFNDRMRVERATLAAL